MKFKHLARRASRAEKKSGLSKAEIELKLGISRSAWYNVCHGIPIANRDKWERVEAWILNQERK